MKTKKLSISIKIAILVMIVSLFGIAIISYFSYSQAKEIFISHTAEIIAKNVDRYKDDIKNNIERLKYNIKILTYNPSTKGFFRAYLDEYRYDEKTNRTFSDYKQDIITIMSLMMNQNSSYYQIRVIDRNGNEIIKLVKEGRKIEQVKEEFLQNKQHRKYFIEAMKADNDVYVSNINLNKEFNKLEFPLRPTVRIAKAIYVNGKKVGIIVINANIKQLFNFKSLKTKDISTFITNQTGYYLLNYQNPVKEFGFEFGRDFRIYYDFEKLKPFYFSNEKSFSYIDNKYIIEARKVDIAKNKRLVIIKIANIDIFKKKSHTYLYNLVLFIIIVSIGIALITTISVKKLTKPIEELTILAKKIATAKGDYSYKIDVNTNDEIGELAKAFKIMLDSLERSKKDLKQFANNLEKEVDKKTKELQKINKNLQEIVEEKVKEVRDRDKILLQQSKMAAMGEMIGAIAHQWRQPLNSLALNIQLLEDLAEENQLTPKKMEEFVDKNMQTIQFMSQTIDDFRNFFRKDKEVTEFDLKESIEKTINLQRAQLQDHNISLETHLQPVKIKGYKNEFMQVILNLISNAKDAIIERRKIVGDFKGKVVVTDEIDKDKIVIRIKDNGGGIPEEVKERIFEPYFTTKEEGKGTGIGLYMVKEIVERMGGKVEVRNVDDGAEFIITFTGGG